MKSVEIEEKKKSDNGLISRIWKRGKHNIAHPKNIKMNNYVFSVAANATLVYYIHQKYLEFPFWMGAVASVVGYFWEKGFLQEIGLLKESNESDKTKKTPLISSTQSELTQILTEYNLNPTFISEYTDEFNRNFEYHLKANVNDIFNRQRDIEVKMALKEKFLSISIERNKYIFSIKNEIQKIYKLDEVLVNTPRPNDMEVPYIGGIDKKTGKVFCLNLVKGRHFLFAGKTGSGKSCTMQVMLQSMMYWNQNVVFILIDFKELELPRYKNFENCIYIEPNYKSVMDAYKMVKDEIDRRKKIFNENGEMPDLTAYNSLPNVEKLPYIVVVMDEAASCKSWGNKEFDDADKFITGEIIEKARAFGIHCIFATQRLVDERFPKNWSMNTPTHNIHAVDKRDVNLAVDSTEYQKKVKNYDPGDFVYSLDDGNYREARSPYISVKPKEVKEFNKTFRLALSKMYGGCK